MIIIIIPVKQASYCLLMLKLQTLQISFCQAACVHAFTCGVCWLMCKRIQVTLYQALLCESCGLYLIIYLCKCLVIETDSVVGTWSGQG